MCVWVPVRMNESERVGEGEKRRGRGGEEVGKEEREREGRQEEGRSINRKGWREKEAEAQVGECRMNFAELNSSEKQPLGYSRYRLCGNYGL